MKVFYIIAMASAITANGCNSNGSDRAYFESNAGGFSQTLDFGHMTFTTRSSHNPNPDKRRMINCSDKKYYCMTGPFFLKIEISILDEYRKNDGNYDLVSKDLEKECKFSIIVSNSNSFINEYGCEFFNGMPWPRFELKSEPVDIFRFLALR